MNKLGIYLLLTCLLTPCYAHDSFNKTIERHIASENPINFAPDSVFDGIVDKTIQVSALSDLDVAGVYAGRMASGPASPYLVAVDNDLLSRSNAWLILLDILKRPKTNGVRGGLWTWLSNHPNYPHIHELLSESIQIFKTEGEIIGGSPLSGLANFIAYVGTPEQSKLFDEIEKAGGIGIDLSRKRYEKRIKIEKESSDLQSGMQIPKKQSTKKVSNFELKMSDRIGEQFAIPWLIAAMLIVAAGGLLWLLLKKRK